MVTGLPFSFPPWGGSLSFITVPVFLHLIPKTEVNSPLLSSFKEPRIFTALSPSKSKSWATGIVREDGSSWILRTLEIWSKWLRKFQMTEESMLHNSIMMLQRALFSLWEDLIFCFWDQLSETEHASSWNSVQDVSFWFSSSAGSSSNLESDSSEDCFFVSTAGGICSCYIQSGAVTKVRHLNLSGYILVLH